MGKKAKKVESKTIQIAGIDFQYAGVDADYGYDTDCHNSGCREEGICRCGLITNAHITTVDLISIRQKIASKKALSVVERYCLERILVACKVWSPSAWEASICGGYYGQELKGVVIDSRIAKQVEGHIAAMRKLKTNREKIEFVLNLEYGYILDVLQGKNYFVKTINKDQLVFQNDHYRRLDRDVVENYVNYDLPRGIVVSVGNKKYRLIDGYHRCAATEGKIMVLVAR